MRRCLATLLHKERVWNSRTQARATDLHLREGIIAYAIEQAAIRQAMRMHFRMTCLPAAQLVGGALSAEWTSDVTSPATPSDVTSPATPMPPSEDQDKYDSIARLYALDDQAAAVM